MNLFDFSNIKLVTYTSHLHDICHQKAKSVLKKLDIKKISSKKNATNVT